MYHIFYFKIEGPNYFNWYCTKEWYLSILHIFSIRYNGFKRQITKHPHANCAYFIIRFLFIKLTFRVGLQHITWFWIRNEEIYNIRCKIYNWYNWPPF